MGVSGSADSICEMTAYPGPVRVIRKRRGLLRGLLAAWFAVVATITLTPTPAPDATFGPVRAVLDLLTSYGIPATYLGVEFAANVVMFVPFGILAGLLRPRRHWWLVVAAGATISCLIEFTQMLLLPTRVADPRDLAANTAGAAVGVALALAVWPRSEDRHKPAIADEGRREFSGS